MLSGKATTTADHQVKHGPTFRSRPSGHRLQATELGGTLETLHRLHGKTPYLSCTEVYMTEEQAGGTLDHTGFINLRSMALPL